MDSENWKEQYKEWKGGLKPFQLKLLDEGAKSQSQAWLLNSMWCDWQQIKKFKETNLPSIKTPMQLLDPWAEDTIS